MAVIASSRAAPILGGIVLASLSSNLGGFEVDYWPLHQHDIGISRDSVPTHVAHVDADSRVISAGGAASYQEDYYDRVHARPALINIGNLVSAQLRYIEIWNAWRTRTQTADSVGLTNADGIELIPPSPLPITFTPLQSLTWSVQIDVTGAPSIDGVLQWQFADATQDVSVTIIGNRVTAWTWTPDWTNGVAETLSWLTSVNRSPTAAEQRRGLRLSPRALFEFDVHAKGIDRAMLDLALYDGAGRTWMLPIFHDQEWLAAPLSAGALVIPTAGSRDYHDGGWAMLRGGDASSYEIVQIDTVGEGVLNLVRATASDWVAGDRLLPARLAYIVQQASSGGSVSSGMGASTSVAFGSSASAPQISIARQTDAAWILHVMFQLAESYDWTPQSPSTMYLGAPVLEAVPDESTDLAIGSERVLQVLDNATGVLSIVDSGAIGFPTQSYVITSRDRAGATAMRGLFYWFKGQLNRLWIPTFAQDLVPVSPALSGASSFDIARCGYTRFGQLRPGRRDIQLQVGGQDPFYCRITDSEELDLQTERLAIDPALPWALDPSKVIRVSFLSLCRLSSDDVAIDHVTDADGCTSASVVMRALRDELELA